MPIVPRVAFVAKLIFRRFEASDLKAPFQSERGCPLPVRARIAPYTRPYADEWPNRRHLSVSYLNRIVCHAIYRGAAC